MAGGPSAPSVPAPDVAWRTAAVVALAGVYVVAAKLGFTMAVVAEQVTAVWPPTGIALAALVLLGPWAWPGVLLGAFLANVGATAPLWTTAAIAAGNTLEAAVGAWVLRRAGCRPALDRVRDVVALAGVAAVASTAVSATVGVAALCLAGVQPWHAFGALWAVWWIGDVMGDLVAAPLLLVWIRRRPLGRLRAARLAEAAALGIGLVALTSDVFVGGFGVQSLLQYPVHYLIFPFLIWAAVRFDQRGTTAVTFAASALAIFGTVHGRGPFGTGTANERLILLQLFMAVVALTGLFLGAAICQHRETAAEREALLARERTARSDAEAGQHRLAFLSEASVVLASSLDYGTTLEHVARLAVPVLADYCVIDVFDADGTMRRVAAAHADPAKTPVLDRLRALAPSPDVQRRMTRVIRTGQSDCVSGLDPVRAAADLRDPERREIILALGPRAYVVVALRAHDRTLGTMTFVHAESQRRYGRTDVALAEELARRAATAIEKARLHEAERRARTDAEAAQRRAAFLAESSALLGSSLDHHATLAALARLAVPAIADWCAVDVVRESGALERVALVGPDPAQEERAREIERRHPFDELSPFGPPRVIRDGQPQLVSELPEGFFAKRARSAEHLEAIAALGFRSYICAPLPARGRTLGALTLLCAGSGRRYGADDLRLVEELARRAGLAIDNARLYESERRARADAEEANRTKDEFLTTVSHELRTPLQAMLGWVGVLRHANLTDAKRQRALDIIEQSGRAQAGLIGDLLDVSRIVTGRLRLHVAPVDLRALVMESADGVRPAVEAKGLVLGMLFDPTAPTISGDADRLKQIFWNLLTNAVKFTPAGGRIDVRVERVAATVRVTVSDTGDGIPPEALPHVFERFWQVESSRSARRKAGVGLGLAIVRHLTELHGGEVAVASGGAGKGTTFTVSLPVAPTGPMGSEEEDEEASPRWRTPGTS